MKQLIINPSKDNEELVSVEQFYKEANGKSGLYNINVYNGKYSLLACNYCKKPIEKRLDGTCYCSVECRNKYKESQRKYRQSDKGKESQRKYQQSDKYKEFILSQFLTGKYGWMCPFRNKIEKWYDETVEEIINSKE